MSNIKLSNFLKFCLTIFIDYIFDIFSNKSHLNISFHKVVLFKIGFNY